MGAKNWWDQGPTFDGTKGRARVLSWCGYREREEDVRLTSTEVGCDGGGIKIAEIRCLRPRKHITFRKNNAKSVSFPNVF